VLIAASVATAARVRGTRKPDRLQTVNAVHDVVTCGGGYDLATVDGFDRVGPDCETVTRRTSLDPYRNPVSEHATEVEPDSAAFGTTVVAVFQVGRYFDGGSHNIGFAVSKNSGLTWRRGFLHGLTPRVSDPAIAYDQKHGEWLAISLVFGQGSYLAISRSTDGRHWSNPVQAVVTRNALGQDKEWIPATTGRRARISAAATSATATSSATRSLRRLRATAGSPGRRQWPPRVNPAAGRSTVTSRRGCSRWCCRRVAC